MRPHAFAYKMCADFPAPVSRDGPIVLGWAARSVATGISRYGTPAASGAGVSSYREIADKYSNSTVVIDMQWGLYDRETGKPLYHKTFRVPGQDHLLPAYVEWN